MSDIRRRKGKNGNVTYQLRWYYDDANGIKRRASKTYRTHARAKEEKAKVDSDLHLRKHVDPRSKKIPFSQLADEWQQSTSWLAIKATTKARYESVLRVHLLPLWGNVPLETITRGSVDAWVADLIRSGMPLGTIQKIHSVFRSALSYGVDMGRINDNPAKGVKIGPIPQREMLYLDPEEVNALADAVPARYRAAILLGAYGGLRAGEMWGLKRKRLNTLSGKLTVAETVVRVDGVGLAWDTPKTHERRTIDLPPFLCKELDAHLRTFTEGGTGPEDVVFTNASGGLQSESRFLRDVFKPAVLKAVPNKPGLRFHDLRHTCATLLIAKNVYPLLISRYLGHSSIKITMDRYGHLLPSQHEAAMRGLEELHQASLVES